MDGKERALDNVWIERFWKSLKYDYVYLHPDKIHHTTLETPNHRYENLSGKQHDL
jgi:putative transposase